MVRLFTRKIVANVFLVSLVRVSNADGKHHILLDFISLKQPGIRVANADEGMKILIPASDWKKGTYFIQITQDKTVVRGTVVIQ